MEPPKPGYEQEMTEKLLTFIRNPNVMMSNVERLETFLKESPAGKPYFPQPPHKDVDLRVELLNDLWQLLIFDYVANHSRNRQFLAWTQAFLSELPITELRALKQNPDKLRRVCRNAPKFVAFINKGVRFPYYDEGVWASGLEVNSDDESKSQSNKTGVSTEHGSSTEGYDSNSDSPQRSRKRKASPPTLQLPPSKKPRWKNGLPKDVNYFKSRDPPSSPSPESTSDTCSDRRRIPSPSTFRRDRSCIVSHKGGTKRATYIVSPEISKDKYSKKEIKNHWEVAECLFGHDKVFFERIKQMLTSPDEVHGINNTFTLNDYMYQLWRNCYFGLRPINPESVNQVRLEFVWFFHNDINCEPRAEFTREDLECMFRPFVIQKRFDDVLEINSKTGGQIKTGDECVVASNLGYSSDTLAANQKLTDMFTVRWTTNKVQFLAAAAGVHLGESHDSVESYRHDWTKFYTGLKAGHLSETESESEPDYP